jgi:hypothetical protein
MVHKREPTDDADQQYDDAFCKDLFDSLSRLPQTFYSSEGGKPLPLAQIEEEKSRNFLIFKTIKVPILHGRFLTTSGGTIGRSGLQVPFP